MDIQSLKKYIRENNKVEYILSSLGCHKIKHNINCKYYSAAHKDGDNPSGIVIYDNEYLNYVSYSRNIGFDDCKDIINLIQDTNRIDFVSALKWVHKILKIEFTPYRKVEQIKFEMPADRFRRKKQHIKDVNVADIREISEEAINDYVPMLHIDWLKEGIMPWTRKKFGLCYSYKYNRMIVPLRYWADGRLLGFNQRTMVDNWKELGISKYLITPSYQKSLNLYGLWENKESIEQAKYCVIFESEKGVLKRHSRNDSTCVALQGKTLSDEQRRIMLSLNIEEIIIALDNDVDINEIRYICEKFYPIRKVSYICDYMGVLGAKDSPSDANEKDYQNLFEGRIQYGEAEHNKYITSLKK